MKVACLAVLCLSLVLAGCWDERDTNQLALITAFGVDWINGGYVATAEVINPRSVSQPGQGSGSGGATVPETALLTGHGSTPEEALDDIEHVASRRAFWATAYTVVAGSALAERGIEPLLDAMARDTRFRITPRVLIARRTAQEVFASRRPGIEASVGQEIYQLADNMYQSQSAGFAPHAYDLMRWDAEQRRDEVVIGIAPFASPIPNGPSFILDRSAVLRGGRLIAWVPRETTRMVLWLNGLFRQGSFALVCPGQPGRGGRFRLIRVSERSRPVITGGRLVAMDVRLAARAGITHSSCSGLSLRQLRGPAELELRSQVEGTIRWAQQNGDDVFGWGEQLYRARPQLWSSQYKRNWTAVFASLPVRLSLRLNLQYTGDTLLHGQHAVR